MKEGYVYILINPALRRDYLKIGMTSRSPEIRAQEISKGTGIPAEFHVAYEICVPDCAIAEDIVHNRLDKYRLNDNREFFVMPLKEAINELEDALEDIIYEVGTNLRLEVDKIFSLIKSNNNQVPKKIIGGLIHSYIGISKYLKNDSGLVFRVALVSLILSGILDDDESDLREYMASFAERNFNSVVIALPDAVALEEIGETLYFLPYHAYINRIIALVSLNRIREAEQLSAILKVRLSDKELDKHVELRNKLIEQYGGVADLIKDHKAL
ncbi:MAG: hypothetical protein BMS9Abin36_0197 [Gammaproteobacteria bacterium]|nr:MAG: hypothetical protein BMS9Abin36_0197 [Gammaproteobacteria bacterium]